MFGRSVKRVVVGVAAAGAALGVLAGCIPPGPPGGVALVSNEAQLRAAFGDNGVSVIKILADIDLENCDIGAVERPESADTPVTLYGLGHTVRQTCAENVFIQNDTSLVTVNNLTITGGNQGSGRGGGFFAEGPLTIVDSRITGNHATTGGGLGSNGLVTLVRSIVDANSSGQGGSGGIWAGPASPGVVLTDSTVSNNVGGGVSSYNTNGSVRVVNSTVSGNTKAIFGAGIFSAGSTVLVYATVVGNQATTAFDNIDGLTIESFGSVVAGGASPPPNNNCVINPEATLSHGYNFSDDTTCSFTDPTDRQNAGDPMVGQLADNGGPTQTMLPAPGSPLLDWIPVNACRNDGAAGITTDQRGVRRPQGNACDIGSVEVAVSHDDDDDN
jgi:hypothetical protein